MPKKGALWGKQVQIFITDTCNLACDGCPYPLISKSQKTTLKQQELTPNTWQKITDYLYRQGIRLFCLIGGEPASYSGIDKVIRNITDYPDAFVLLSTSGIHPLHDKILRKKIGQALSRPRSNKFHNGIAISFDAIPASSGPKNSRQLKAQQGLDFIQLISQEFGNRITYTANVMLNPANLSQVLAIQSFLEERDIFTNICTQQMKCFHAKTVFNQTHLPKLTSVAQELIKRKTNQKKIVNSVPFLSQLPLIVGLEKYHCWQEPQGSPVLDFAPNGHLRYCNWIGADGPANTPSVDITAAIEKNKSIDPTIWAQSKKITQKLCQGCSWSRRDRNMPPMVQFNHQLKKLDPTLPELQNIWVQAQSSP